jgi:hypothetical protein
LSLGYLAHYGRGTPNSTLYRDSRAGPGLPAGGPCWIAQPVFRRARDKLECSSGISTKRGNYGRTVLRLPRKQASRTSFLPNMWCGKQLRAKRQRSTNSCVSRCIPSASIQLRRMYQLRVLHFLRRRDNRIHTRPCSVRRGLKTRSSPCTLRKPLWTGQSQVQVNGSWVALHIGLRQNTGSGPVVWKPRPCERSR